MPHANRKHGSGERLPDGPLLASALVLAERAAPGDAAAAARERAAILGALGLDDETLAAAACLGAIEDGRLDPQTVEAEIGEPVVRLVEGARRMDLMDEVGALDPDSGPRQIERLRRLLLALAEDVRVVFIKLADRVERLRRAAALDATERSLLARQALDVYAPLAGRLGIARLKWELEDLAFRQLEAATYRRIARQLDLRRADREHDIAAVVAELGEALSRAGIRAEVSGRPKHIYSIWRKMQRKQVGFDQLFDLRAVRVLVDDVTACYAALGVVHTAWPHIAHEFDDYITNPKSNRYQSLHTAVIGPGGRTLEVQIRTREMHAHAELGVAAHWQYKEGGGPADANVEARLAWLRQVLEVRDDGEDAGFLERFGAELFSDRVYVVTPRGAILDLPAGATPLDFAYQVHTDVGHRCRGAKVNGTMVPLTYRLRSGERVEVLTARNGTPSRDWLNPNLGYLATPRARAKVRHWFRQQDYDQNLAQGHDILQRELRRLGIEDLDRDLLLGRYNFKRFDDLLAAIGRGDVTGGQLVSTLQQALPEREAPLPPRRSRERPRRGGSEDVRISGVGNLLTTVARCCHPVPPDAIQGFITKGRGVTVHRHDCGNLTRLAVTDPARVVDVTWSELRESTYPVDVQLTAYDRQGLLRDITSVVANEDVNVTGLAMQSDRKRQTALINMTVEVANLEQLARVLDRVAQQPNVIDARRV